MAPVKDPSSTSTSVFKFEKVIQLVRKLICKSGILNKPCTKKHLKPLDGSLLHHDLVNFSLTATENYQNYLKDKEAELLPVFVTCDEEKEYNDMNNWTKSMIVKRIEEMLLQYPDINKAKGYLTFLKKAYITKLRNSLIVPSQHIVCHLKFKNIVMLFPSIIFTEV